MKIGNWDTSTWVGLSPNGRGRQKPDHYGDMARIAWKHRGNWPYAWRILTRGVCDGCALGTAGLHDWTIDGIHLCLTRLELLELNTMGPLDVARLADVAALEGRTGEELRRLGRLPVPMRRAGTEEGFRPISWEQAYDEIASALRHAGGDRSALYLTSRGLTNEVYYAAQKAWRGIGSPHIDNAARVCHAPSTVALKETLGVGATTCSYKDLFETDLVVLFGSDVANAQPVMMKYLYLAKKAGVRVVVVNPFREPGLDNYWVPSNVESALFGTKIADDWFLVRTGGDIAFCAGVLKVLITRGSVDLDFVGEHTEGFGDLARAADRLSWDDIEAGSGLGRTDCERFADIYGAAERAILIWSMGITQHRHGTDNVRMLVNLALARAMVGRDGCGLMPIRGHSGVQGGAEMGAYATALPGGKAVNALHAAQLGDRYGFEIPASPGRGAVEMIDACERGELDVLYSSGGNFLDILGDPAAVRRALERVPLRVHQDVVVSSQMLVPADHAVILLPAMTRYEQPGGGTETTTERRVIFSPEIPGPRIGKARAEWEIFGEIARRVRSDTLASFGSAQEIRDEIAEVVAGYKGIESLRDTGDEFQIGGRHLCQGGVFPTPTGRGRFSVVELPDSGIPPGLFRLSTRRGKQFNSMVQAEVDPLTGAPRDAVFVAEEDASSLGLVDGDRVELRSAAGKMPAQVRIARMAPRNVAVFWPEGNVLLPGGSASTDPEGGVPDDNVVVEVVLP